MKRWFTSIELTQLPDMPGSSRRALDKAKREGWPSRKRKKGKGLEYFPPLTPVAKLDVVRKRLEGKKTSTAPFLSKRDILAFLAAVNEAVDIQQQTLGKIKENLEALETLVAEG